MEVTDATAADGPATARPVCVLHVDDDEAMLTLTASFLESQDDRFTVMTALDADEGLGRLATERIDCVVSDYDMPGLNGLQFLRTVRSEYPDLPFILFTGKGSEEVASEAISAGVTDYLQKSSSADQYTILVNRIVNAVEKYRAVRDLERRSVQYEAVADLGRRALAGTTLDELFTAAVSLVAERLETPLAKVLELDEDGESLLVRAGVGWTEGVVGTARVGTTDSQAGHTLSVGVPVVVSDLGTEPRFDAPAILTDHGAVSGISVVVGSAEDPWGVLGAHTTEPRRFTEEDVTFVENVANVLGAAIEREESDRRLRESERRFREIAELNPDGVFRLDREGVFIYASPASEALLGNPEGGALGTEFRTYVAEDALAQAVDGFTRTLSGEVVRDLPVAIRGDEGAPREVEVSASPIEADGEVVAIQGIARDVTERKRRERDLQESRARYEALVENLPNGGMFLFDEELRFTLAGGTDLAQTGLSPETVVGRTPSELFPPENAAVLEKNYRATLAGERRSFEDSWQGRTYQVETVPLRDADGAVTSGMAVAQNMTERKRRERELERRTERLDEFASVVSHDLRSPLAIVRGRLELAAEECNSEHLPVATSAADRMATLVEDLLRLARQGRMVTDVAPVDLAAVVEDCWQHVETGPAMLELTTEQTVLADRGRLEQLFENLIRNAVEHGSDDGAVTVTVGARSDGFYVEDDGPGIPETEREKVLEAGYSTLSDGTGFGLNIVSAIVEAHGWALAVTESAAGGARFEVTGVDGA